MSSYYDEEADEQLIMEEPGDEAPSGMQAVSLENFQSRPIVVYVLLGVTIAVYVLQFASEQFLGYDLPAELGVKFTPYIAAGQWWRLVTPMFLHGSIMHLGFNMYALFVLGPGLERFYGHGRFILLYFLAGFAGNVCSMIFTPNPSLGSSTAIFGLLGAQAVFLYLNREIYGHERTQQALRQIGILALINFVIGLSPGIDNWGHVGGFLGGVAFAWFGGPVLKVKQEGIHLVLVDVRTAAQTVMAAFGVMLIVTALAVFWIGRS